MSCHAIIKATSKPTDRSIYLPMNCEQHNSTESNTKRRSWADSRPDMSANQKLSICIWTCYCPQITLIQSFHPAKAIRELTENKKAAVAWLLYDAGEIQKPVLLFILIIISKQTFQYGEGFNKCLTTHHFRNLWNIKWVNEIMEARTLPLPLVVEEFRSEAEGKCQCACMQNMLCIINNLQLPNWLRAHYHKCLFTKIIAIQIRKPNENNGSTKMLTMTNERARFCFKWEAKKNLKQSGLFLPSRTVTQRAEAGKLSLSFRSGVSLILFCAVLCKKYPWFS